MRIKPLVVSTILLAAVALAACAAEQQPAASSDAGLEARARAIHERVITIDTHDDIPLTFATSELPEDPEERSELRQGTDPGVRGRRQVDFPKMREGGLDVAFFIVYVGQGERTDEGHADALRQAMTKFEAIHRAVELYPDQVGLATSPDEVERIVGAGKLAAAIGIENGYPMGHDLSLIERFKDLGAGYMGITHNRHNDLGDSHTPAEPEHGGLSELGEQVVAELNRAGIMIDVSHASKQTMLDVLRLSQAPVIASHSSVRAVQDNTRNLDDEQLLALKENGGVMQTVALGSYVKVKPERQEAIDALRAELGLPGRRERFELMRQMSDEERAAYEAEMDSKQAELEARMPEIDAQHPPVNVSDFVDHIDYAVELIGVDHVGISSDFDGGGGIDGWQDASETFNVTLELVRRGYSEEEIAKLWGGNLLRVWRQVEQVAERLRSAAS